MSDEILPEREGDREAVEGWFGIEYPGIRFHAKPPLHHRFAAPPLPFREEPLAESFAPPYLLPMALPKPVRPSAAIADLVAFFKTRRKHQWAFAAASLFIPLYFVTLFILEAEPKQYKNPDIVFVQNYKADRTDAEIKAQQAIDSRKAKEEAAALKKAEEERRKPFVELDKKLDSWGL